MLKQSQKKSCLPFTISHVGYIANVQQNCSGPVRLKYKFLDEMQNVLLWKTSTAHHPGHKIPTGIFSGGNITEKNLLRVCKRLETQEEVRLFEARQSETHGQSYNGKVLEWTYWKLLFVQTLTIQSEWVSAILQRRRKKILVSRCVKLVQTYPKGLASVIA